MDGKSTAHRTAIQGYSTQFVHNSNNRNRRYLASITVEDHDGRSPRRPIGTRFRAVVTWEALDALSHQLELCKIDAATRVLVLVDASLDESRTALVRAAVTRTGAEALFVQALGASPDGEHDLLAATVAQADLVISLSPSDDLLGSAHDDGPQHLRIIGDARPQDFPPHANLRRRVNALASQLTTGQRLHISDAHGTDFDIDLGSSAIRFDHGLVDDDLDHAEYPAGWVAITPAAQTVTGDLVIMPGDVNLSARRFISSPVRLQIQEDHVVSIDGESPDADVLRALFEFAGDPAAYGIAEVTTGMNPGSHPLALFDDQMLHPHLSRLHAGTVTVSFGNNLVADRPCDRTISLALPARSVAIDDLPVARDGNLLGDFAPDVYER